MISAVTALRFCARHQRTTFGMGRTEARTCASGMPSKSWGVCWPGSATWRFMPSGKSERPPSTAAMYASETSRSTVCGFAQISYCTRGEQAGNRVCGTARAHLERWSAVQAVVLVRAELVAADVRLERLEVGLDLVVADQAVARAELEPR